MKLREILEQEQKDMYDKAKAFLDSHIDSATDMKEMEPMKSHIHFEVHYFCQYI